MRVVVTAKIDLRRVGAVSLGAGSSSLVGTKTACNIMEPFFGENLSAFETKLRTTCDI